MSPLIWVAVGSVLALAGIGLIRLWVGWIRHDERQRLATRMESVALSIMVERQWGCNPGTWSGIARVIRHAEDYGWDK